MWFSKRPADHLRRYAYVTCPNDNFRKPLKFSYIRSLLKCASVLGCYKNRLYFTQLFYQRNESIDDGHSLLRMEDEIKGTKQD